MSCHQGESDEMRGVITLTEGRSGASWLCSLADSTGRLGTAKEWVDDHQMGVKSKHLSVDEYIEAIIENGKTENNYFALKLFPRHLHWFQIRYDCDLISRLRVDHDLLFVFVSRRDRIMQAVSFSKAIQTRAWRAQTKEKRSPDYDFLQICRSYFMVNRSYDFWESYVALRDIIPVRFVYEDLLNDPSPFVHEIAKHAGVDDIEEIESDLSVQRDEESEKWRLRFLSEARDKDFIQATTPSRIPSRKLSNILKFARGKQMRPVPFSW